mgnify:FL=1
MKDSYKCYEKVLIVIVTAIFLCSSVHVRASGVGNKESAQEIVNEYFSLIGNDWDKFAELYTNEQINSFKNFLENEKNIREYVGVLNVRKAKLIESIEIKYDDVKDMIDEDYTGKKIKIFAVGADYDVYEDTKYFSEGIIYNFLILEEQNGQWRVNTLMQIADPSLLKMKGYHFQSVYNITENIMEARENGYLVNGKGKVFSDINEKEIDGSLVDEYAILNKRTVPTDDTTISYGTYKNGVYQNRKSIKFHDYCKGVSAGEVRGKSFDGTARKAVDIAIKTYTWHYKIVPIDPTHSVDIKNTMQSYKPEKISENKKVTSDYNAVKNIWMESYKGNIFAAGYGAGDYNSSGKNGGRLMQNGCRYLVDKKKYSFYQCLHYYYDYSIDGSTGGPLRFFDNNKIDLGK